MAKKFPVIEVRLEKIVGGGQALGQLDDGRKIFIWGGLPGELVRAQITKKKSSYAEGKVVEVLEPSNNRIEPRDPGSFLSTSPWQIMTMEAEQHYKAALIEEAFELHDIVLPNPIDVYTDGNRFEYRNKLEFSWYGSEASPLASSPFFFEKRHVASLSAGPASRSAPKIFEASPKNFGSAPTAVTRLDENLEVAPAAAPSAPLFHGGKSVVQPEFPGETGETRSVTPSGKDGGEGGADPENKENLDLAFFIRGSKGKVPVSQMSLARPEIVKAAVAIRDLLRTKDITARNLKTVLVRADQKGNVVWQLYIKDEIKNLISGTEAKNIPAQGGEVIYSDPKSPASKITKRLAQYGDIVLSDEILGVDFRYATEGFFQINLPVYGAALHEMKRWVDHSSPALPPPQSSGTASGKDGGEGRADSENKETADVLDLYSGVGTIGLTIGGENVTLVEIDEHAVREMKENIARLGKKAEAVLAPSEKALDNITSDQIIIVDPPRAGLHEAVVERLLEVKPSRIIYLSCNPVTQARDVAKLSLAYGIRAHQGYNFFPCTPHIEHLVVLDLKP